MDKYTKKEIFTAIKDLMITELEALDKTEKEYCNCKTPLNISTWRINHCRECDKPLSEDSPFYCTPDKPKPSPVELPEKLKEFRGDYASCLLAGKIDEIIDYLKARERCTN